MREHYFGTSNEALEIMPDNWQAVELFCFCSTQWQFSETGHRLSLNYPAVIAVFQAFRVPQRRYATLLADIRLIEYGALKQLRVQLEQSNGA